MSLPSSDGAEAFLHILNYIALTATSLGLDLDQLRCRVQYLEPGAKAATTLEFRLSNVSLDSTLER